jgi:hypothetical protein
MDRYLTSHPENENEIIETNVEQLLNHNHGTGRHSGSSSYWYINRAWSDTSTSYALMHDTYNLGYNIETNSTGNMFSRININNNSVPINNLQLLNTSYVLPCIKVK